MAARNKLPRELSGGMRQRVTYKPIKQLALQAGYSHFFAGSYLKDTGANDDADFGYVQATIEF